MNRTYVIQQYNQPAWFLIDAKDKTLGRLSTQIANTLKNKHSIYYTPYQINKAHIIIINAAYIKVSGQKQYKKMYRRH